jgi:hypothetical protein
MQAAYDPAAAAARSRQQRFQPAGQRHAIIATLRAVASIR